MAILQSFHVPRFIMEKMITIGKIVGAFGIRGEIKVYAYADNPELFSKGRNIIIVESIPKDSSVTSKISLPKGDVRKNQQKTSEQTQSITLRSSTNEQEHKDSAQVKGTKKIYQKILSSRKAGNTYIMKLNNVDDRNTSEQLRDFLIQIPEESLPHLPANEFYIRDLKGSTVFDIGNNEIIGTVEDILTNRAQDVYVIRSTDGFEVLIPAVREFVKEIDIDKKSIYVKLIDGMKQ